MIFMGNSTKAVVIWAVVALVITGATLLVVTQVINDTNDEVNSSIDRAFEQSEQLQEQAFESAEELQQGIDESVENAGKGEKGSGGTAAPSAEEIQEQVNEQLEAAGIETP